ncbi:MAG TPA: glycosyltransferase family 39 protein [Chloroflexota bacterium]|nr:glycosyltransferase family 39 protein [Chloroflexota bacterium]
MSLRCIAPQAHPCNPHRGLTFDPKGRRSLVSKLRNDRVWEAAAIAAVLLAAAALRLVGLASLPPGLFQDEAINGVNVQTILAGAPRIYYGEREPLFMYLAALVTLLLGPTPLALRVTAALSGVVGVAAAGAFGRQLFGRTVGLLTAAGVAASLWLTVISRIGLRAITLPAVECLGLALLWRATRTGRRRDFVLSGAVLGFSLYTYLAARFLPFALAAFVVVALVVDRPRMRRQLSGFVVAGIAAVVVCLPLGVYALHRPDMLFGRPDQVALPGGSAFLPALVANVGRVLGMILVYGDPNWRQNFSGAPVFDPLNGVIFLVGLVVALGYGLTPRGQRRAATADRRPAALLVLVLLVVMLVPSMLSVDSPHYLRTAGAALPIYALWALGLAWLARTASRVVQRPASDAHASSLAPAPDPRGTPRRRWGEAVLLAAIIAVAVGVAFARTGWTYFVDYARNPAIPDAFNADLAAAGRFLSTSPIWQNDRANVFVTDDDRLNRASVAFFLYLRLPPADRANWLDERTIGSFFAQNSAVPLPVAPSLYVVSGDGQTTLDSLGPAVQRSTWIEDGGRVAGRAIWAAPATADWFGHPVGAQFGRWLELERAQVTATNVALRWRILAVPDYQPSVYVHVQDDQGHTLATADQVVGFAFQNWRVGQELVTWHPIHLPPGTPPGRYHLTAGVYRKETGAREPAVLGGQAVGDVAVGDLNLTTPVAGSVAVGHAVDRPIAPGLSLAGYDLGDTVVEAGTRLSLTLVWKATGATRPAAQAVLFARTANGATVGEWNGPVGGAAYPSDRWPPDAAIRQVLDLPISATASGPVTLTLAVRTGDDQPLGAPIEIARATVKASTHQFAPPHPSHPLNTTFAGVGTLIGDDLPDRIYHPGDSVPVTLYWRSAGAGPAAYTVFVHLLDAQSHVVGQRDEPPVHGSRPTTSWVVGEYLADEHDVTVDAKTPAGSYLIEIGLYDPRNGQRVATGTPDNRVLIGSVRVG